MEPRQQLYHLLEQMVESAESNEPAKVSALHEQYKKLRPRVYSKPMADLDYQYDNCRISCISSVTLLSSHHKDLVKDAKARLAEIPKP